MLQKEKQILRVHTFGITNLVDYGAETKSSQAIKNYLHSLGLRFLCINKMKIKGHLIMFVVEDEVIGKKYPAHV